MAKRAIAKKVSGIDLMKVDEKTVDSYLSRLNLEKAGDLSEKVERLSTYLESKLVVDGKKSPHHSTCKGDANSCGGVSDARFTACPYCGDSATDGSISDHSEDAAVEELRVPVAPVVRLDRRRRRGAGDRSPAAEVPEVKGPVATEEDEQKAETALALRAVTEATDDDVPPPGLVAVEDEEATVADLDRSVAKIRSCVGETFESMYDLGQALADNFGRKLYLRREKAKKPLYASWRDFVKAELSGIGVRYSYQLMRVSVACSREAFAEIGVAKMNLVLAVGEEDRPELLQAAKTSTLANLRDRVHDLRTGFPKGKEAPEREGGKSLPPPPERARPAGPPPDPAIVHVPVRLGRTKLKLYARPLAKNADPKRAKKIGDDPYALELLKNGEAVPILELLEKGKEAPDTGVHVRYSIQLDKTGALVLQIDRSRGPVRKD